MVTNFKKSFLLLITAIFFTQSLILGCSTEVDSEIKKMEEEKPDVITVVKKTHSVQGIPDSWETTDVYAYAYDNNGNKVLIPVSVKDGVATFEADETYTKCVLVSLPKGTEVSSYTANPASILNADCQKSEVIDLTKDSLSFVLAIKMFTVTYKSEFANDDVQAEAEGTVLELPTPSHKGYRFDGWYTNAEKTTKAAATYTIAENLTFYAKWVQQGTVKFTSAQSEHADITVDLGEEIIIEDPTKEKFAFDGWFIGETKVSGKYTVTKDVELVAKWTALYNVTFETAGGSPVDSKVNVRAGTKITLPPTTLDGYDFEWWATEGKTYAIDAEYEVNSDVIFVAKWAGLCTVVYNTDGGSPVESKTVHDMETIEMPAAPTKDGHRFLGWYTTDENNLMQPGDLFNVTDSVTINAKWIAVYTYEYNDGIPADEDPNYQAPIVDDGYVLTLKAAPVRPGYVFKGWSVDEQTYQPGASYTITANVVFEAIWVELFTYEYNDGIPADEDPNYQAPTAEDGEVLILKSAPVREGYVFKGWKVGEQLYDAGATYTITADVVFVAVWNVTVTVTYVSEHTEHEAVTIEKGSTLDLPTTPTVEGYDFDGWFNEGDEKVDSPYTVDANITLTAKWTKLWTVTYMSDGVIIDSEIVRDGESIVLETPSIEKPGYTFDCWQDGEAWINADSIEITADITLTARWEKIPVAYTISGVPTTGWGVVEVYVYNEVEGRENGEFLGTNNHAVDGEGNITFETAKDITHCILVSFGEFDPNLEMPSYSDLEDLLNVSSTYSEDLYVKDGSAVFETYKEVYTITNVGLNNWYRGSEYENYIKISGDEESWVKAEYDDVNKTLTFKTNEEFDTCVACGFTKDTIPEELDLSTYSEGTLKKRSVILIMVDNTAEFAYDERKNLADTNIIYFRDEKSWQHNGDKKIYANFLSTTSAETAKVEMENINYDSWFKVAVDYEKFDTVYFTGNDSSVGKKTESCVMSKDCIFYRPTNNEISSNTFGIQACVDSVEDPDR